MVLQLLPFLSLLLCLAACGLWIRSLFRADRVGGSAREVDPGNARNWRQTFTGVATSRGSILVGRAGEWDGPGIDGPHRRKAGWTYGDHGSRLDQPETAAQILGFGGGRFYSPPGPAAGVGRSGWAVRVPCWFVALAAGAPALAWYARAGRHRLARRRTARGLCLVCGYDLRASPSRCPECGAAPSIKRGAA